MYNLPMIDMTQTGKNICALRVQRGFSVRKLQTRLGFATPQAIYKWQQGTTLPSIDNLMALASIFNVSVSSILNVTVPGTRCSKILPFRSRPNECDVLPLVQSKDAFLPLPIINMTETGKKISALRIKNGLSVRALQTMLGFATPQAIYKWQQGTTLPSIDNLVALSVIFHVPIEHILAVDTPTAYAS